MALTPKDKLFLLTKLRDALAAGVEACDVAIAGGQGFTREVTKSRFAIMHTVLKGLRDELKGGAGLEKVDAAIGDLLVTLVEAGKRA